MFPVGVYVGPGRSEDRRRKSASLYEKLHLIYPEICKALYEQVKSRIGEYSGEAGMALTLARSFANEVGRSSVYRICGIMVHLDLIYQSAEQGRSVGIVNEAEIIEQWQRLSDILSQSRNHWQLVKSLGTGSGALDTQELVASSDNEKSLASADSTTRVR